MPCPTSRPLDRVAPVARVAAVLVALLAPRAGLAGPPFMTDDPEPVELHHWELYLASQLEYQGGDVAGSLPHFEVNYGAVPDLQLHAIVPLAFEHVAGSTQSGLGDLELGFKYRFLHETDARPQVGIFPLVELPTGDSSRGLGAGKANVFIPVWLQKSFGKWTTYGGGGFWVNPGAGNQNWWSFGWQVQRELSRMLIVGGELVHHTAREVRGEGDTRFNVGAIVNVTEQHHLLASWGRTIDGPETNQAYVAYQLTFGPAEEHVRSH